MLASISFLISILIDQALVSRVTEDFFKYLGLVTFLQYLMREAQVSLAGLRDEKDRPTERRAATHP